jgi:DNA-binding transcriptional MerR regulator
VNQSVDNPTEAPDRLLAIGVFARRARLSHKALRLYDRMGLLVPAEVDADSSYRRYRESQLGTARLIVLLRRLDMPLGQVAQVVSAPAAQSAELIRAYWDGVERRIAVQRGLAAHLSDRLSGGTGDPSMFTIEVRDIPAQQVLTEQRHVTATDLPGFIAAAMTRLIDSAGRFGGMTGPALVIYHGEVDEDGDGPVEVCVPVRLPGESAAAGVAHRVEPAHREAYTRIKKSQVEFPQILSAFDAVAHWLDAESHEATLPSREVYFTDWDAAGPDDEVCDIAFPFATAAVPTA